MEKALDEICEDYFCSLAGVYGNMREQGGKHCSVSTVNTGMSSYRTGLEICQRHYVLHHRHYKINISPKMWI